MADEVDELIERAIQWYTDYHHRYDHSHLLRDMIDALRALRKEREMALRLARTRGDRLNALRACVKQNKGDELVRVEVEWLLECHHNELDAESARGDAA